jgi:hypothetical protein
LAAVARSQATAAVAKVKEAAAATDFLAALKSGDIGVLAAKMGPYGRLLLSTLTWIKDLLLEKLTELAASVKLPLPPVRAAGQSFPSGTSWSVSTCAARLVFNGSQRTVASLSTCDIV